MIIRIIASSRSVEIEDPEAMCWPYRVLSAGL